MPAGPQDRLEAIRVFIKEAFPQASGSVVSLAAQRAEVRLAVDESHLRPGGTVSGPAQMAIADFALYVAVLNEIGLVPLAVTTNLNMHFLRRPAPDRDLTASCQLLRVGGRLIVGEVTVYSDGDDEPIAHAVGTYSVPPDADRRGWD